MLTAGRDVPNAGQVRQRGEGVAIVLSGIAVNAWKPGGNQWKAWSSRLITATLEVATREEKDQFFDECYVMLGDFNARVGSRGVDDGDWWYEKSPHGQ